jgi:DNA-binding beta-propeller fold protein YncE
MIYGNDEHAKTEISAAEQSIGGLPQDSTERKDKIAKMQTALADLKEKFKKIVKADKAAEVLILPASAADGSLAAPVLSKDTAYAVDNSSKVILKVNLTSKDIKRISLPETAGTIVAGTEGATSILFASKTGRLYALKKADDSVEAMPWSHSKSSSTADVVLYASRLYSLDTDKNQVWRSQISGGSVGGEAAYIKAANTDIRDAVALAIDSNVYVLKNNGTLIRFLSGGQEGFGLAAIDPTLKAASGIWTDSSAQNIYVTDPADKRLLVFDKNGLLKAQIVSSQFRIPRDVSADEGNKRAVVVDGNRLLLVPLP